MCGILVEEFAVGMGPKVISAKKGDTVYSLRLFPIGGFCAMLGDVGEDESRTRDPRAFQSKTLGQRFVVLAAGSVLNFLLAFVCFTILIFFNGFSEPVVSSVVPNSPAMHAGLQEGDRIIKVDGDRINIADDLIFALNKSAGKTVDLVIMREKVRINATLAPVADENGIYRIGIQRGVKTGLLQEAEPGVPRAGLFESARNGFWSISYIIRVSLYGLSKLITMQLGLDQISGIVGIVFTVGESYTTTVEAATEYELNVAGMLVQLIIFYIALLSANLGVMNLLPLPALDGGRLIFLLIRKITGKAITDTIEGRVHLIGIIVLFAFMALITMQDIGRFFING